MRKYGVYHVTKGAHSTIGYAIVATLNQFGPGVRVLCVVHHPANDVVTEYAEVIVDVASARRRS